MGRVHTNEMIRARKHSIQFRFSYRGQLIYESWPLEPSRRNLAAARRHLEAVELAIRTGQYDHRRFWPESRKRLDSCPTIAEAAIVYLGRKEKEMAPSSYKDVKSACRAHIVPAFGALYVDELTRGAVKDYFAGRPISAKRVRNILTPLREILSDAQDAGFIQANPLADFHVKRPPAERRDPIDPFSPEEVARILAAADHPQEANLWQFAFWTGARTSELIAVQWGDIDRKRREWRVQRARVLGQTKPPKTDAGRRVIRLLQPAVEALAMQRPYTRLANQEVFWNPRTRKPWTGDKQVRVAWQRTLARAGVPYRRPYNTRHTFASTALTLGENPLWVAKQLGHTSWEMTARAYARYIDGAADMVGGERMERLRPIGSAKRK